MISFHSQANQKVVVNNQQDKNILKMASGNLATLGHVDEVENWGDARGTRVGRDSSF